MLEPLVLRHRTSVAFNLAVMLCAALLGVVALYQARRRRQSEAQASEQVRIRELERQLFHAERLSTVGRLAAGIAHEINNPLEGMANYLRLAEESIDRGEAATARARLDGVRQGLDRAAGIVRRVLSHAEPADALHEDLDAAEVLTSALEFVRSRDEFAALSFEIEPPDGTAMVHGNGAMLSQVFLNLLLNACEAQPDGGEVSVRCRRRGEWVECDVADRGPGVPPTRRSRIFEPFETTKRSTGLGLSVCHAIVRRHEGELTVHEREGGGAVFRVRLRAAEGGEGSDAAI